MKYSKCDLTDAYFMPVNITAPGMREQQSLCSMNSLCGSFPYKIIRIPEIANCVYTDRSHFVNMLYMLSYSMLYAYCYVCLHM